MRDPTDAAMALPFAGNSPFAAGSIVVAGRNAGAAWTASTQLAEGNGSAGPHLLDQAEDLFASPLRPNFLPQRFKASQAVNPGKVWTSSPG
jgi:hypothetical protein